MSVSKNLKELVDTGVITEREAEGMVLIDQVVRTQYRSKPLMVPFLESISALHLYLIDQNPSKAIDEVVEDSAPITTPLLAGLSAVEDALCHMQTVIDRLERDQKKLMQLIDVLCEEAKK